jgi:hypothetical protein
MIISDLPNANALASPLALQNKQVGMVSYRTSHKLLQPNAPVGGPTNDPADPSWAWPFLDSAVAQATQYGIPFALRVFIQSSNSPLWLRNIVQQYVDVNNNTYNIWWDTNYQAYLIALIQAISNRWKTAWGATPLLTVVDFNPASQSSGDWSVPHAPSQGNTNTPPNWKMTANVTCPAYGKTAVVTPVAGSTVRPGWYVFRNTFGWFQVQSVTGPQTNPTSVTLLNPGTPGNASSGTIGSGGVFQVSDVATLTGPVYGYTTNRFVNALTAIISAVNAAFPNQIQSHEIGRSGTLDPNLGANPSFQYNSATAMAQWAYANIPLGKFAIAKNTINSTNPSPSDALSQQDGSDLYLPAQAIPGSSNTSGTSGVIPRSSRLHMQFNWFCYDVTNQYTPDSTANNNGPYAATGGVPYSDPVPVFQQTLALAQSYGVAVLETYEVDIIYILKSPDPQPWQLEDGPLLNPAYCGQNQTQQIQVPASVAYKEPPYAQEEGPWVMPPYASIYPPPTQGPGEVWVPPPVKQTDIFLAQQTWPL